MTAAVLLAAASPGLGAARTIVPGVTYDRISGGGQVTHVVRVAPGPLISLRPERAGAAVGARSTLSTMMRRRRASGALIGINGDFFNFAHGYPSGMLSVGGELIHEPEPTRTALGVLSDGSLAPVRSALAGEWTSSLAPDPSVPFGFSGLNRPSERVETILYTPRFGGPTPVAKGRTDAQIRLDAAARLRPNRTLTGTVVALKPRGGLVASGRNLVLTGIGTGLATRVATYLKPGARVTLRPVLDNLPQGLVHAIGGGPLLVDGGIAVHGSGEGFTLAQVTSRTSRSAVAQTANGQLVFVVAEGPLEGSRGITVDEQADLLASLGVRTAVAMDGGGSATMAVGGHVVNKASVSQRALADALVLRYRGIQLSDPAALITPNGDGSRDGTQTVAWAAKSGSARISLMRSDGRRIRTLYSGPIGPSPRSIRLAGRAVAVSDGRYRVVARFVPADRSEESALARRITIDRTLGHLSVSKVGIPARALQVRFRLAHAARVTAVVTNAAGRTVRVLIRRQMLPRGIRTHLWDLRVGTKRLRPGAYRLSVSTRADGADRLSTRFRIASGS